MPTKKPEPKVVDQSFFVCRYCGMQVKWLPPCDQMKTAERWVSLDLTSCEEGPFNAHAGKEVLDADVLEGLRNMIDELAP